MKKRLIVIVSLIIIFPCCLEIESSKALPDVVKSVHDVVAYFPTTSQEIRNISNTTQKEVEELISTIINTTPKEYSFKTTFGVLDKAFALMSRTISLFEIIFKLNPDEVLRKIAEDEAVRLQQLFVDLIGQNKNLYNTLSAYANTTSKNEDLTDSQKYFIKETLEAYRREGLDLPDEKQDLVKKIKKELADLSSLFDKNINDDIRTIKVSREALKGIDEDFINELKKTSEGLYILNIDEPTYYIIMKQGEDAQTRKKLFEAVLSLAFPANMHVLEEIIAKRNELAQLLHFPSFAHLDIAGQMAKTPETVEAFLKGLLEKSAKKASLEFADLTKELPPSVVLTPEGKLQPWDRQFLDNWYIKKHYDIDPFKIAEYFPMEKTIEGLFDIYQQFFDLHFEQVPLTGLWDKELKLLEVYKDTLFLGYIILDLHPRDNKRKNAFNTTLIPALRTHDRKINPALTLVNANFPKATATKPSLLLRIDVSTFFHEFGHALHALLGATELESQSGTNVKTDFVELPSQMLEEWLFDKDILHNLSSHYKTDEKLSTDVINTIISLKKLNSGKSTIDQLIYSYLALRYFGSEKQKDTQDILKNLQETIDVHTQYDPNDHFQTSFNHLTGYGAKYYSYLWSQVFALDLFNEIKKQGLLNPIIGKKYSDTILSKGGSKDPELLLIDFLGRKPNSDAFFKDLGL